MKLGQVDVKIHEAMLSNLCPIVDFDDDLSKLCVEVALEKTYAARFCEESILSQEEWLGVEEILSSLDKDILLKGHLDIIVVKIDIFNRSGPLLEENVLNVVIEGLLELSILAIGLLF